MPSSILRPDPNEYFADDYQQYINLVTPDTDALYQLEKQRTDLLHMMKGVSDKRAEETYEPGKWTIKELLQHLIDSERIFSYRALCFCRGEEIALPAFDENKYAFNSLANIRMLRSILEEYDLVRRSSLAMFRSFTSEMLDQIGLVNGNPLSARALAYIIPGHELHHLNILRERYSKV